MKASTALLPERSAGDEVAADGPTHVMIVTPALELGAADAGAVELTRLLHRAGKRVTVVSRAGRRVADVTRLGGRFVPLNVASPNPMLMLRNAAVLRGI